MTENPLSARATRFVSALRHCQVLGITVHAASEEGMTLVLPYSPSIVGDPQTGVIHGGALTSLMDTACGMATLCVL
ncbi:TPA: thioesterase, partial [Escherichia coli]|nr:thioesterase [Escherichia coli]